MQHATDVSKINVIKRHQLVGGCQIYATPNCLSTQSNRANVWYWSKYWLCFQIKNV